MPPPRNPLRFPCLGRDIANLNNDIVRGKLNKSLKPLNPSKHWSPKEFFGASGYYVQHTGLSSQARVLGFSI